MSVTSTRNTMSVDIQNAILKGLSDGGGLFVFSNNQPTFFNMNLQVLTYKELTIKVFESLLKEYPIDSLRNIVNAAYDDINFPSKEVSIKSFERYAFLELYNGPTFAFKDMALSVLPLLIKQAKIDQNIEKPTLVLTATSGDTGSAALSGFSQDDNTHVIVLYPKVGISEFQELQMNGYQNDKLSIFGIDGNFDDCQAIVKQLFFEMKPSNIILSSANSINIGRLIPQVVYYMYSYLELVKTGKIKENEKINVSVPSGNFGNIYAAYLAKSMGTPINKLIIASNQNNVLTELFNTGVYNSNRKLNASYSPSMDILVSSNFERYLYDLVNQDQKRVKDIMEELTNEGSVFIKEVLTQKDFYAEYCSEEETLQEIKNVFKEHNYMIDPHTAVGSRVYKKYIQATKDETYTLLVSTASPFKFSTAMCKALDIEEGNTIKDSFNNITNKTNVKPDQRMLDLLNVTNIKKSLNKDTAFDDLKRMIGEIDDQY